MKFDNYEDAILDLAKFRNLVGAFYPPSNQKIWGLFVGISDTTISQLIYKGIRGDFPLHTFNLFALNNIEFWAGFYDDSIVPLTEILQDEFLASLCEPRALNKEVDILEDWSDPIRIPKGLTVKLTLHNDKKYYTKYTTCQQKRKLNIQKKETKIITFL